MFGHVLEQCLEFAKDDLKVMRGSRRVLLEDLIWANTARLQTMAFGILVGSRQLTAQLSEIRESWDKSSGV